MERPPNGIFFFFPLFFFFLFPLILYTALKEEAAAPVHSVVPHSRSNLSKYAEGKFVSPLHLVEAKRGRNGPSWRGPREKDRESNCVQGSIITFANVHFCFATLCVLSVARLSWRQQMWIRINLKAASTSATAASTETASGEMVCVDAQQAKEEDEQGLGGNSPLDASGPILQSSRMH
jgi:hypothetical protein